MNNPQIRWQHGWETTVLEDGTRITRSTVTRHRIDMVHPTWQQRIMLRVHRKQGPPAPDTPERFYLEERFG